MDRSKAGWLNQPAISRGKALAVWAAITSLATAIFFTDFRDSIDDHIAKRLDFHVRKTAGLEPDLSSRLKIIAFDDATINKIGNDKITLKDWATLLRNISKGNPNVVIIDKAFAATPSRNSEYLALKKQMRDSGNIYVGALSTQITQQNGSFLKSDNFSSYWSPVIGSWQGSTKNQVINFMGPSTDYLQSVAGVGHFMHKGYGRYKAFERYDQLSFLPHLTFYAADSVEREGDWIKLNGNKAVSLETNKFFTNHLSLDRFASSRQMASMHHFLGDTAPSFINEGDTVLVFLEFFTGGSDFKDTPVGHIPGGLVMASVLNSVITGNWLLPTSIDFLAPAAGAIIGIAIAWATSGWLFWLGFIGTILASYGLSMIAFAELNILVPWLWFDASLIISGAIIFVEKHRIVETRNQLIKLSLSDKLSPYQMQKVLGDPPLIDAAAYQKTITLMFLDIVGYSKYSENTPPHQVFADLRAMLSEITSIIHKYGGSINNTFGDGLLAVFGYDFDGKETDSNHAAEAVKCATELQKKILERNLEANRLGDPIHPIRIGVNTGPATIGDLGDDERFNFTVIGHAVNYAKRLEEACEFYRIMLGQKTMAMSGMFENSSNEICNRLILMKHHERPLEAFELDPLANDPELSDRAHKEYWVFAGIAPREKRIQIPGELRIPITTNYGEGYLTDFSHDGMAFFLKSYLANGMTIDISIGIDKSALNSELTEYHLSPISAEVRWGAKAEDGYRHGILLRNLNSKQKERLFTIISNELLKNGNMAAS